MPFLILANLQNASGNPSGRTSLLPGGANTQVAGTSPNPYLALATIEATAKEVLDQTSAGPALQGQLLVMAATSAGGGNFILSAAATAAIPKMNYGIVQKAATAVGALAVIIVDGVCMAYCTATTAIAAGDFLAADGAGNLTRISPTTPGAGTVLAIALGALAASTSTPTLVPVKVGGF